MPPKKKAADDGTGDKAVKKPRVARKKVPESGEGEKVEKKPRVARKSNMSAKLEVTDDVVEFVEVKVEGGEEKKARATRTKKPALSLEEIAEKGRGLIFCVCGFLKNQKTEDMYRVKLVGQLTDQSNCA
jgi:hypothetical protein